MTGSQKEKKKKNWGKSTSPLNPLEVTKTKGWEGELTMGIGAITMDAPTSSAPL